MAKVIKVEGYDAFQETIKANESPDKTIFVLFSGSVDENGKNWCPDCVVAEPVVNECMSKASATSTFIYCSVGDRTFWKNTDNVFRKDPKLKLKSVPTLIRWNNPQRLEEAQCSKQDLVQLLIEDES